MVRDTRWVVVAAGVRDASVLRGLKEFGLIVRGTDGVVYRAHQLLHRDVLSGKPKSGPGRQPSGVEAYRKTWDELVEEIDRQMDVRGLRKADVA